MKPLTWKQIKKGMTVMVNCNDTYTKTVVVNKVIGDYGLRMVRVADDIEENGWYPDRLVFGYSQFYPNNHETKTWLLLEGISIS